MITHLTSKGQVTIPKPLRERYGIRTGMKVSFSAGPEGIRLRKVVDRLPKPRILGCLKHELAGRSSDALIDELRGPVALPPSVRSGLARCAPPRPRCRSRALPFHDAAAGLRAGRRFTRPPACASVASLSSG